MTDAAVSDEDFEDIRAATRHFVRSVVMPREMEIMAQDRVPDDIRDEAKKMGLFGYAIPQDWGGLGLNLAQDVELAMELGYTTLALRSMFGTNNGIAGQVLVGFGTDEQKARWLEGIASGDVIASFALTEPGAGSNPAGLRTKAIRDGDQWVITGQKRFITNAPTADLFVVFARTRPADADSVATTAEALDMVRDLTYGVMADGVVVSPSLITGDDVDAALKLTRKGGTCVLTGMTSQTTRSIKIDLQQLILWNKNLVGTVFGSCNPKADIARLATLYHAGQLYLDEMITKRYRLDDINDAYADLLNGEIIRGVIDFDLS